MTKLIIEGGRALEGEVTVQGAKTLYLLFLLLLCLQKNGGNI